MVPIATRRERVILELEDRFSSPMARAAAAAKVLDKSLDDVDSTTVRTSTSTNQASKDLDRFSGRLSIVRDVALTLGPALVPIGAVAIPAVSGLAAQMGAAAVAGGTMLVAFQGVGDTLEAVSKAALEPTTENLEAARVAMEGLSPQAAEFVTQLQSMRPAFLELRDAAAAGLFPGLTEALDELLTVAPRLEGILNAVGDAAGDLATDFAEGLAGPRGQEFLRFIEAEIPSALTTLGHTVGNLASGLAEMWMAFTPVNTDFADWMLEASRAFDQWADGLSQTDGFRDFVAYVRTAGPQVADAMGAIGNALLKVAEAAAPLGGPVLAGIEAVANVIAAIADSRFGPALIGLASGLALTSRALKGMEAIKASSLFQGLTAGADGASKSLSRMERVAVTAAAALAAFAVVDAAQGGLEDYSIGIESMTRSLLDLDAGAADLPANLDGLANSIDRLADPGRMEALQDSISNALGGIGNEEEYDRAVAQIESLDAALAGLVNTGNADTATNVLENLGLSESQMQQLLSLMPQYEDALAGAANQARLAGQAGAEGGAAAARGFERAKSAAQEFADAVQRTNRILEGRSAVVDYEQAVDDMTKSIKENGRTLDANTQKGRNNRTALDNMASSAVALSQQMRVGNRLPFLEKARGDIADAAMKLGLTRAQANALADKLLQLDKIRANPKVTVETARAQGNVQALLNAMAQIRDRTVTVTTVFTESGRKFKDFDSGGYTGPGHYKEPRGIVHAGEVVIPQKLVQRDWSMLSSRYGHLPGFDSGGLVPRASTSMSSWPNVRTDAGGFDGSVSDVAGSLRRLGGATDFLVQFIQGSGTSLRKELQARASLLDEELAAGKERLSSLRDQQRAFSESVAGLFRPDLFGGSSSDSPLSAEQQQAMAVASARASLTSSTARAQEAMKLYRELRRKGFSGPFFRELVASGDVTALRGFAELSRAELRDFSDLYAMNRQASAQAGRVAGQDFSPAIRAAQAANKELTGEMREVKRAIQRLEKDGPERTGKAAGKGAAEGINRAVTAGFRGRR